MSTWILLRGLTRETRHWGRLPDVLREAAGASGVSLIDLPGNGEFAHLRAPATVAGMVDFVRIAAVQGGANGTSTVGADPTDLSTRGPFNVLAMSLGGMVATAWAQRYPDEIGRLVLINTSMRPFSRVHERLRPSAWPDLLTTAMHWNDTVRAESAIHRLTCNNVDTLEADLQSWSMIRRSAPVSRGNALRQLSAAARFTAGAAKPACPLLILSSHEDRLVDPVCSAKLAAAWGARHRQHAWAGHDLPHDDPAWVGEQVSAWLAHEAAEAAEADHVRQMAIARLQHKAGQRV
ncbi:alpha/beta fold hydrolase [Paraburkholderia strydomiana]|uniref:alpha/beta fold hydrolase n=1 Tax=Paraburkholderia strydomiana TaxID=1245417 RepID=UPI0028606EF4|nr:alpha/beta hydrolase [Paraburkholderia strydomiana]MDR7005371.1 pimeloyl-ACP methyl ester carboxylesterase [Paraburkholderia strydomiana]